MFVQLRGVIQLTKDYFDHILFGGDYSPEQWDVDTVRADLIKLKEAGVNTLTLPVFAWSKLEPSEGQYNFDWLDKRMELFAQYDMGIILSTPTAAQPAWMSKKYPEVLPVDISGRKRTHGMRAFFCVSSEKYRERAAAIAEKMAIRYGKYKGLLGWHVGNEYGTYCYCETCRTKFIEWLRDKYKTVSRLNEKWNTNFWGRQIYDFEELDLPTELNDDYQFFPAMTLDYRRFMTDSTLSCFQNEANVLRKITPNLPIFSNISGFIKKLDQFKLTKEMDTVAWDNYPSPKDPMSLVAMKHDLMRGLKNGLYIVSEQSPNQQNWQLYNKLKRPGEVRRLAYQGIAHGSNSSLYFQMKQSVGGQEKFHGAFISHADRTDTRIYKELQRLGSELSKIGDKIVKLQKHSEVAILFDWDNWWSSELASGPSCDTDYLKQIHHYYEPFYNQNISVDFVSYHSSLCGYKIILAPMLYMMKDNIKEKLENFVRGGGTLLLSYLSGMVDETDRCIFGAYPGPLRNMAGVWVEETDALYADETVEVLWKQDSRTDQGRYLCDQLRITTARTLATYNSDFYAGSPAVTENKFGKGMVYYVGTQLSDLGMRRLMDTMCEKSGIQKQFCDVTGCEISIRSDMIHEAVFAINHDVKRDVVIRLQAEYEELLSGQSCIGNVLVHANSIMIFYRSIG